MNSPTIVAAALSDQDLKNSIDKLVQHVDEATKKMAQSMDSAVEQMKKKLGELGNVKIDFGGTADGGSSRRTSKQKDEESQVKATAQAYKEQKTVVGELAMSFDNLNTAITKSNSKLAAKFDVTEQQKVQQLEAQRTAIEDKIVARQIEIDESYRSQLATLSKTRSELESKANLTSKEQADLKHVTTEWERINKIVRDISSRPIVAADDPTGSIGRLQQQLVETNKQLDESRKRIQEMNFEIAKMYDGSLSGLVQNAQATMKYQNDTLKKSFEDLLKKPTHDVDEMRAKMERLQTFLNNIKPLNIFSPELIANGERAINKLKNEIQKFNDKPTKQAFADALKLPDRTQSEIITKINKIRDAIKGVEGTKIISETEIAKANSLIDSLRDKWSKLYNAPKDRKLRIDFADALKMPTNNIDEIAAKLMRLQWILQEMRGMQILSPEQISRGNQQISALLSKLEAEMSLRQQINAVEQTDMQNAQKRIELEAKYGEEVAKAAAIANDWLQKNKEASILNKEGTFVIQDPKAGQTVGQSIEAQLLAYKAINGELNLELEVQKAIQNTVESIERAEQRRIALAQGGNAASNKSFADYEDLRTAIAAVLRVRESEVSLANSEDASYKALSLTLKQLKQAYESLDASQRKSENSDALIASIHETQRAMQEIQNQMSRPVNLANVLALPEKNIDDISYKVQMLRAYAQGINIETNAGNEELRRVMSTIDGLNEGLKNAQKTTKQITIESNNIKFENIAKMPTESLKQVGAKIKEVKQYINELKNKPIVDEKNLKRAEALYDRLIKQSQKLNETKGTHSNVNDALNVRVKTLDDIAKKMQRLQAIRQNLDINKQKADIDRINAALGELKKQQDGVLQRNANMIKSNTALGRSWNYMKNRLAFYFSVGASTAFIKNLIEVRSQYEMNERALGILINSAERGTQIFNELSQMALVSPYTLIELSNAAKQLTAYDIAAKDVVDTTRRLADMASAVGVPMERLTYALGQIKAYGYLNSRDARMFANAGIPLVRELSKYYTELEGKMVSVGDVYDRMKKKAIDYNDVMSVVTKMTDEGGKFFDFQEKMADTLKVRLANLTLAWNNMLNDIGKSEQGVLTNGIGLLKELFLQWKNLNRAIEDIVIALGVAKAAHIAYYGVMLGTNKAIALETVLGTKLSNVLRSLSTTMSTVLTSGATWWSLLAVAAGAAVVEIFRGNEAMKEFNKTMRENAKNTYSDLEKFNEQYKELRDSLYKTTTSANGKSVTVAQDISSDDAKKAWEAVREQIELSSHASSEYIGRLLQISNVSERLRRSFAIIDDIQSVSAAIKELGDNAISLERDWSGWWNLWLLPDGTIGNLKDTHMWLGKIEEKYGSIEKARRAASGEDKAPLGIDKNYQRDAEEWLDNYESELKKFREDLESTKESVLNFINVQGWSGNTNKINEVFKQITDNLIQQNQLDPQKAFTLQLEMEEARTEATRQAYLIRIKDEQNALRAARDENEKEEIRSRLDTLNKEKEFFLSTTATQRVYWNDFTKYLKEQHLSEMTAMFRGMNAKQIESLNFQEGKYAEWVKRMVTDYAKSHKLSYDEAFNYLRNWVTRANQWSIFIPLTISTEDQKTVRKSLEEADAAADKAWKDMQRLDKEIARLRKKGAKEVDENNTTASDDDRRLTEAIKERAAAEKDYNKAVAEGGESKKENAAATKAQKAAESELQKALKEELKIIDQVSSAYKKMTDSGINRTTALSYLTSRFGESIEYVNKILGKNNIPKFDIRKFAGTDDPNKLLEMLQEQINAAKLSKNIKPEEISELRIKYDSVDVDAKSYNATKIKKGLDNELGRLKEEYELAVELDANPELGNIFTDMFDIDLDTLPKTAKEYAEMYTKALNKYFKEMKTDIELPNMLNLTRDDMAAFQEQVNNNKLQQVYFDLIQKGYEATQAARKKEATDTINGWNKLLEKYAEYEAKISKITADAERERKIAISKNAPQWVFDAINNFEKQQKAQAVFERFQKQPEWLLATGDLAGMTNESLKGLVKTLEDYKRKGNLTEKQTKQINKALVNLHKQIRKGNPFHAIADAIEEANMRASVYDGMIEDTSNAIESYMSRFSSLSDEEKKKLKELIDEYNRLLKLKERDSKVDASTIVNGINEAISAAKTATDMFGQMADALGGEKMTKASQTITKVMNTLQMAASGAATASQMSGGNGYAAIAGAVIGGVAGVVTNWADEISGNANITDAVNDSIEAVKNLDNTYKNLSHTVENAYGANVSGAQAAAKANKELQLIELQRQLVLEKSRESKNRDDDKIIEIEGQIIELKNEINNASQDIINDLLGISSAGDGITSLVQVMVDAFKNGEDAMQAFGEEWEKMIDNMILKLIVSKFMQQAWDDLMKYLDTEKEKQLKNASENMQAAQENYDKAMSMTDDEIAKIIAEQMGLEGIRGSGDYVDQYIKRGKYNPYYHNGEVYYSIEGWQRVTDEQIDAYRKNLQIPVESAAKALNNASIDFTQWSLEYMSTEGREYMTQYAQMLKDSLGDFYTYGQDATKDLSALQQGIQGITETTAGAIEAYLNGVSQQVYLQSDYLRQIVEMMSMQSDISDDAKVASLSQILLQLQSSYQTQEAIRGILEGWSSPDGLAVRVEMN